MSAISNAKWNLISQLAKLSSQFINLFVLSRILAPSDYGLMGMVYVVTNFGLLLKDMGTTAAIIQDKQITASKIEAVFWFNIFVGIFLFLIVTLSSSFIAAFFSQPALKEFLVISALIFPISSLTAVHQALLEKESKFNIVARIELISILVAVIVAVAMALNGYGVYSLVIQAILTVLLTSLQLLFSFKWKPVFSFDYSEFKTLFIFSSNMTGFQIVTYAFRNLDTVVIGKFFGPATLGFYSIASKIMLLPIQNISWIAARSLYPVMSKSQEDNEYLKSLFLKTLGFIAFFTAPTMVGIFVLKEEFINLILGSKWVPVAEMLGYLAPVGFFMSILGILTTVLMAKGKANFLLLTSSLAAVIHFICFYFGMRLAGINGLICGYLIATLLSALLPLSLVFKLLDIKPAEWLIIVMRIIAIALFMGIAIELVDQLLVRKVASNQVIVLLVDTLVGAIVYFLLARLFIKQKLEYLRKVIKKTP